MEMKKQVCSYEQALTLSKLGVLQSRSQFVYCAEEENDDWELVYVNSGYSCSDHPGYANYTFMIDTYTVAELGIMLGDYVKIVNQFPHINDWNEAKDRADFLISFLINCRIKVETVNKRLAS